ncbi:MAG: beta-glucosidase [Leptospiraceae bacterium]|nr:beta-glucosidase [Leptospiraceae bacterium]
MKKSDFPPGFIFGTSTAAYQIEGAVAEDGRGPSIWDDFSHTPGKIAGGDTGDVACDHYHRFESDLDLMKDLGIKHYRFSLSWSRILPYGVGARNPRGVDFYHRLLDACIKRGIEPFVTIYHWDLPSALESRGGWTSRDTYHAFCDYVDVVTREYSSKVKRWMILNEPFVFTAVGHFAGIHAPGRKGLGNFLPAAHHTTLAQAEGGRIARANASPDAEIGTTFSCAYPTPYRDTPLHRKAVARYDAVFNRFFLDPVCGRGYPLDVMPGLKRIWKYAKPGDEEKLAFDFDFIGVQNYIRDVVRFWPFQPVLWFKTIEPRKRVDRTTEMGWEIYPDSLYNLLLQFAEYPEIKKIYVTESGAAFKDQPVQGRVQDVERQQYLKDFMDATLRASRKSDKIQGYFVWSFMDNFEWAEGYRPRFGLVYVDYKTQERIAKDSAFMFRDFLAGEEI